MCKLQLLLLINALLFLDGVQASHNEVHLQPSYGQAGVFPPAPPGDCLHVSCSVQRGFQQWNDLSRFHWGVELVSSVPFDLFRNSKCLQGGEMSSNQLKETHQQQLNDNHACHTSGHAPLLLLTPSCVMECPLPPWGGIPHYKWNNTTGSYAGYSVKVTSF